jgi:ABC-type transport system involved in cytochrome c biogenesis permease subunit
MTKAITFAIPCAMLVLLTGAAFAHHGWGSYDAAHPVTVAGPILTSKFENPHATITIKGTDKTWTVTLAPVSRMSSRGATEKVVAAGQNVSAYGYPSTAQSDEMRAERITVDGKTYELR